MILFPYALVEFTPREICNPLFSTFILGLRSCCKDSVRNYCLCFSILLNLCASLSNAFWSGQKWKWDCTFGLIVFDLDKPHIWDYIFIAWCRWYCYLLLDCVYLARKQIWDWIFVWVCWIWVNIRTEKSHTSYTISFWIVRCP